MENLKVYVKDEVESEEVQKLLFDLNCYWYGERDVDKNNIVEPSSPYPRYIHTNEFGRMYYCSEYNSGSLKTIQQLRKLVVLKRNSIEDATHYYGGSKYYLTDSEFYQYSGNKWVNIDEYVDGMTFKKIGKEVEMKEYLDTNYELRSVKQTSGDNSVPSGWIEVPEGAEEYRSNYKFYKNNGGLYYSPYDEWVKSGIYPYKTLWQRNPTKTPNTSIKDKLKFIEKWLNGNKIQYILGIESEKTQWHNFTEGAMQYIKRSDIKFREAPKYVTINGIEFKSAEKLVKYVKNNFDLEDVE